MSTSHAHNPSPTELLNAIDQLEASELQPFVSQVLARVARRLAPHLGRQESDLLEKINRSLEPEAEARYRELITARQAEALSSDEMLELRGLTDQAEKMQAERIQHLVELAQLRGTSLTHLMAELGIQPQSVE